MAYNKRNVIDRRAFSCLLFSFMQMYRKRNFLQSLGHMFIIFRTQGHQILVCLWSNESVIEIFFAKLFHRGRILNSSINVSFTVLYSPPQMFSQDHSFFFFCFFITHYRRQIRKQLILHCTLSFPYKNHICTSIINGTGIRSDISFLFSSLLHTNKLSISSCVVYFHSLNEYFPYIMTEIIKYICISETYSTVYIRL